MTIKSLLNELQQSGSDTCMYGNNTCCLTVADDMVLVSFTEQALNDMLIICYRFCDQWWYTMLKEM